MFSNWDWEDTWLSLLFTVTVAILIFIGVAACVDHKPRGYYVLGGCVLISQPWESDDRAFCVDGNPDRLIELAKKANDSLK